MQWTEQLNVRRFAADQARRLETRWFIVRHGLVSVGFWTAAILASAWLREIGIGWLRWPFFLIWLVLATPAIVSQLQMIVDVLSYGLTGKMHFFPQIFAEVESGAIERRYHSDVSIRVQRVIQRLAPLIRMAGDTTPLAALGVWSIVVLVRTSATQAQLASAIERREARRAELKRATEISHRLETAAVQEFAEHHMAMAGGS